MCTNIFLYKNNNFHYPNFSNYHVSIEHPKEQCWKCVNTSGNQCNLLSHCFQNRLEKMIVVCDDDTPMYVF